MAGGVRGAVDGRTPLACWVASSIAAALLAHGAPSLASASWPRRVLLPGLAGIGRADRVALTFDDGPDPASTPAFLAALDALGWKATFFLLGTMVRRAPSLAAEVAAAGHEIGLHGDEHRNLLMRGPQATVRDLRRGLDTVARATGRTPAWYRPPYGVLTTPALVAAARLRLRPVLWTTWGRDWRARATPGSVAAEVCGGLVPGATVLLHDSDCTSAPGAWRSALGALPLLAAHLEAAGLAVGPLGGHGIRAAGIGGPTGPSPASPQDRPPCPRGRL
jgi:peptidoglycan/xylan/chitin deacetylase (PgdA/CDA1 family)